MASPILVTGAAGRVGGVGRTVDKLLLQQGKDLNVKAGRGAAYTAALNALARSGSPDRGLGVDPLIRVGRHLRSLEADSP